MPKSEIPKKVFVLLEEVDIVGVFSNRQSAVKFAKEDNLMNYLIEECTLYNEENENA